MKSRNRREAFFVVALATGMVLAACNSGPAKSGTAPAKSAASLAERKAKFLTGLEARRGEAGRAWGALTAALPERVWLTEAAYDAGKIRIKGETASNNLLADYIARLGSSPQLANLALGGSVLKTVRGREIQEFSLTASAVTPGAEAAPAARLEELEKSLPPGLDAAGILREAQRLALDSGFKMTKFTPGAVVRGEFESAAPVSVEVSGERGDLGRYLDGWTGLPGLWIIDRFSMKAASPDDPRSPVRVSIAARAHSRL